MAEVVSTNQFKTGMAIEIEGQPFTIVDFQHVKPGKGGAFVRTKVRNIATGAVLDKTFRSGCNKRPILVGLHGRNLERETRNFLGKPLQTTLHITT